MQKAVTNGVSAYAKRDIARAIDVFQKAYNTDATHPTAPILLKSIAAVKLQRGVETFNAGLKASDNTIMAASKTDLSMLRMESKTL